MGVLWNFFVWLKSNAGSITAICAFFATIFALKAWKVSKNTIRNEIIGSLLKEYRSPEMGVAIRRLYDFYRECKKDESKLIEEYEARYKAEKYEEKDSLHNQQRLVTNFYQHMTALVSLKIINSDLFYEIWDKSSLEIIPNILIPIGAKAIPSVLHILTHSGH